MNKVINNMPDIASLSSLRPSLIEDTANNFTGPRRTPRPKQRYIYTTHLSSPTHQPNLFHPGLLSVVGDPVGQVLDKTLKPTLGAVTGAVGNPTGTALLDVEKQAKKEKGYSDKEKPEEEWPGGKSIGGNQQTGQNPLGL